jgi:hypothetical protein
MQKLAAKYWEPGMVLAKPVENDKGMVLAAEGTELNTRLIELFEQRGVVAVSVEGNPVSIPGKEQKSLEGQLAELEQRFANRSSAPFLMRVKQMFVQALEEMDRRDKQPREDEADQAETSDKEGDMPPVGEGNAD